MERFKRLLGLVPWRGVLAALFLDFAFTAHIYYCANYYYNRYKCKYFHVVSIHPFEYGRQLSTTNPLLVEGASNVLITGGGKKY